MEFLISGYLAVYAGIWTFDGEVLSTILGWMSLFMAIIIMPLTFLWILIQPIEFYRHPDFHQKFGAFFEQLSFRNKKKLSFIFVFMLRRIGFISVSIYIKIESLQIISIIVLNLLVSIYIGMVKPFNSKLRNRIEVFNEFVVSAACIHLYIFTDYVPS